MEYENELKRECKWIVTYWSKGLEPIVCFFDSKEDAISYYDYLLNEQQVDKAIVDKAVSYKENDLYNVNYGL